MLDAAPRVVIDPQMGVVSAGRSAADASIAADIYRHTIEIILDATELGGYRALSAEDIFDVEYWDLEQAKLGKGTRPQFTGEVALVTGAASGIGRACAELLLQQGAAVVGLDLNPDIADTASGPAWLGVQCDVTAPDAGDRGDRGRREALRRHRHRCPERRHLPAQPTPRCALIWKRGVE